MKYSASRWTKSLEESAHRACAVKTDDGPKNLGLHSSKQLSTSFSLSTKRQLSTHYHQIDNLMVHYDFKIGKNPLATDLASRLVPICAKAAHLQESLTGPAERAFAKLGSTGEPVLPGGMGL